MEKENIKENKENKVISNLKRQSEYRKKLREKMGEDEYKKIQAKKKREYRLKKKNENNKECDIIKKIIEQNNKDNIADILVNNIIKKIEEMKKNGLSRYPNENTVKIQVNRVRLLYKYIYEKDLNIEDWDWVKDIKNIRNYIENNKIWKTLNSKNAIYGSLASVLKYIDGMNDYQLEYSKIVSENTKELEIEYGDNKMSENVKKNYVKWNDILSIENNLKNDREKLLYSLYVDIPPRRIMDYSYMKLIKVEDQDNMNNKYNYIIINDKKIISIIFNKYKTSKTYGKQIIDKSEWINIEKVSTLLFNYIKDKDINSNDFIFGSNKSGSKNKLDDEISLIFKDKFNDKRVSVNVLRHSYITYILNKQGHMSINRRKEIAYLMGNSLNSQNNYFYLDG